MPLSVANSNGGSGLSNLLRQTRPAKAGDDTGATAAADQAGSAALRQQGGGVIDSTGSGTAQVSAALTIYLSPLGGQERGREHDGAMRASNGAVATTPRSGASELLRVLDAYGVEPARLSA